MKTIRALLAIALETIAWHLTSLATWVDDDAASTTAYLLYDEEVKKDRKGEDKS